MDRAITIQGNATPVFLAQVLQQAGLRAGDSIRVRVQPRCIEITADAPAVEPAAFSDEERAYRLQIVRRLQGVWSEEDESVFQQMREEMWSQWQPRIYA